LLLHSVVKTLFRLCSFFLSLFLSFFFPSFLPVVLLSVVKLLNKKKSCWDTTWSWRKRSYVVSISAFAGVSPDQYSCPHLCWRRNASPREVEEYFIYTRVCNVCFCNYWPWMESSSDQCILCR
jgi:hypothetical protein